MMEWAEEVAVHVWLARIGEANAAENARACALDMQGARSLVADAASQPEGNRRAFHDIATRMEANASSARLAALTAHEASQRAWCRCVTALFTM